MERPFTNRKDHPVTVGGKRIYPGETRGVEETLHPNYKPASKAPAEPADPALELLDNSIPDIVAKLPDPSDEDFDRLRQGEADGKTRKGLLKAFEEEMLRRAETKAEGGEGGGDDTGEGKEPKSGEAGDGDTGEDGQGE